ncbi:AP-5 complex subunit beta-1-like [Asterias rubens]|uniref:AP-5 complex subunit beta-1-like n=1 Tax=Asterias rubens TaxID=7604 RepID=UPI0014557BEC|nr:AP-5 complex subunit beta-1-like [Asterias rubens]
MAAPNVLETDRWLSEILQFRKNPVSFFTSRQMEAGDFVLDILQALYSDNLGNSIRVVLLSTLQENGSCLMSTPESIEQTVGSLTGMYSQTIVESSAFYTSQLLVTITTILLESGQLTAQPRMFTDFVDLLLDVVSKVNSAVDRAVRGTACQCLSEIETMHPGILMRKLEHFYAMSQLEYTHVCQNYMTLFVQVLKNSIEVLQRSGDSIAASEMTDLLCTRKEPLKPLSLPDGFNKKMFQLGPPKELLASRNPFEDVDCKELQRCFTFLLDQHHLMTTPCAVTSIQKLIFCMKAVPKKNIPPSILKSLVTLLESTQDVAMFHALLVLKLTFGSNLLNEEEEERLLCRLVASTNHPALSPGHRLLCYHWLLHFPENKARNPDSASLLPEGLDYRKFASIYPAVFDGLDTTLVKHNLLSLCFTPGDCQDSASATLIGSLVSLQKSIHYGISGRPAVTLYRSLYLYYLRHHHTVLRQEIYKIIVAIVTEQPKFVPHTINFIECINRSNATDHFPIALLRSSMENIVSMPPVDVLQDVEFHLQLLERTCREKDINPKPTVIFLHQLLTSTPIASSGGWLLGTCILSVCHSIMQHHDTTDIFKEFGQLLFELFTMYSDLDIRDRARFYYAMLTNISSEKISRILSSAGTTQSLTRLVTGSSNFNIPPPVREINQPILCLTKIKRRPDHVMIPATNPDQYLQQLKTNPNPVINMDYYLHYSKEQVIPESMEKLYTLVLHVDVPKNYKPISDVSLPCLSLLDSSRPSDTCQVISLKIQPLQPIPSQLNISTMFISANSETCSCSLPPAVIQFSDLFLPIPVMPSSRLKLFDDLWEYIHNEQEQNSESLCVESVCTLLMDKAAMLEAIDSQLNDFRIHTYQDDTTQIQVGICLPPSWHVLLKITTNEDMAVVAIATDNWKILPLVNTFLHDIEGNGQR